MKTVADGQLASSSGLIYTGVDQSEAVNISCLNTSGSTTETIIVTLTRAANASPTARRICRAVLLPNEQLFISGLGLAPGDLVKAQTTDGTTVDYVVSESPTDMPFSVATFDTNGQLKSTVPTSVPSLTVTTKLVAQLLELGPAPTDTYAATMTLDVTKGFHVINGVNGTSATVTFTPSGAGSAGDLMTILTNADSSGTVTATFASVFHTTGSSGTTQATTSSKYSSITFQSDGTIWRELSRVTAMG